VLSVLKNSLASVNGLRSLINCGFSKTSDLTMQPLVMIFLMDSLMVFFGLVNKTQSAKGSCLKGIPPKYFEERMCFRSLNWTKNCRFFVPVLCVMVVGCFFLRIFLACLMLRLLGA